MSELTWGVELTPMFPCEWYGGPYHNGERWSNDTGYYFRTRAEAEAFVARQNNHNQRHEVQNDRR